jgi:hypothetical protein
VWRGRLAREIEENADEENADNDVKDEDHHAARKAKKATIQHI